MKQPGRIAGLLHLQKKTKKLSKRQNASAIATELIFFSQKNVPDICFLGIYLYLSPRNFMFHKIIQNSNNYLQ